MKLFIYGENTRDIKDLSQKVGFEITNIDPIMIASVGGDGTFMKSEKDFPGIPKFILQKSKTSKKGHDMSPEEILEKIFHGRYKVEEEIKLEAEAGNKKIVGLNEIIVHNADPRVAIRYEIFINDVKTGGEIIGDGVVIATPFGSTGYYRSITQSFFEVGMGLAYNNSTEQSDHMVLKDDSEVRVKIVRGKAVVYADNNDDEIILHDGSEIIIKKSNETAKIIHIV